MIPQSAFYSIVDTARRRWLDAEQRANGALSAALLKEEQGDFVGADMALLRYLDLDYAAEKELECYFFTALDAGETDL